MPKGVVCLVEECIFYEDEGCTADEIQIRSNGNDIAGTAKGTLCATFEFGHPRHAKESYPESAHGHQWS
ncbi:DUF1540 domain-containing protein [Alicyclobacillaceae bacterium I2511]|nr:DUF1540 domain-containing protein [Alicyclobacillaceae bacterium I2511]